MFISETFVQHAPDNPPFIYFIIPLTLAMVFCCVFCLAGACYYKKKYLAATETNTQETQDSETQTVSVDTDIVQIRTVDEPKQVKNAFKRPPFMAHGRS